MILRLKPERLGLLGAYLEGILINVAKEDVELDFPRLIGKDYDLSDEDFNNNCLGFALGDFNNWWEPPKQAGQYWPPGFANDLKVKTVEEIIRLHGFTITVSRDESPQTDAIAIYAIGDEWTHFAKFSDGVWASKLGIGHDVSRVDLEDLNIDMYGEVVTILSRSKQ
jgi:hypothetical protein